MSAIGSNTSRTATRRSRTAATRPIPASSASTTSSVDGSDVNQSGEVTTGLDLSIILPVHNEAGSLPSLWEELVDAIAKGGWSTEVIFVDDGSTDDGATIIRNLCAHDPRVRLLRLDGNH